MNAPWRPTQRKANLRLALILLSVAATFALGSWPRSGCWGELTR
jgi:hypothetical protein